MRFFKQLFIGGIIGAAIGGATGFGIAYFNIDKNGLPFTQASVISVFVIALRTLYLISLLVSVVYIVNVLRDFKQYQTMDDNDSEELYRAMNRKHSCATVFNGVATVTAMVSLILSEKATLFCTKFIKCFY
ncbi:membrane protein [Streptococcus troglodytae]|uniref:Membrane protein n=1 Tax=Streptococcus troglodytae TaxID=1111760 RepID=A0A1L7LKN0_9STRE|nr:DUF3169 family protein [Streptococcus troglodytae]BAQ24729.1 membrane protein [Streptococcus troglodytae]